MALQCGPLLITGTINDVCFYKMHGKHYVRMKSSLTRKRVLKDPKFQLTRTHAALLGEASKITSRIYRLITGDDKKHALYRGITGKAIYLLREGEGKGKEVIFQRLKEEYVKQKVVEKNISVSAEKVVAKDDKHCGMSKRSTPVPRLKKVYMDIDTILRPGRWRGSRLITKVILEKQSVSGP